MKQSMSSVLQKQRIMIPTVDFRQSLVQLTLEYSRTRGGDANVTFVEQFFLQSNLQSVRLPHQWLMKTEDTAKAAELQSDPAKRS